MISMLNLQIMEIKLNIINKNSKVSEKIIQNIMKRFYLKYFAYVILWCLLVILINLSALNSGLLNLIMVKNKIKKYSINSNSWIQHSYLKI
jgi:hypothetical protein